MAVKTECRGWTICWAWFIPYPCRKTWTCWCYNFEWVKEDRFFFICHVQACEDGVKYDWWTGCFNVIGTKWFYNLHKCYKSPRNEKGRC